jgi:hypothetical protein
LATLRDNLWHAVDGKVTATTTAAEGARYEWLAAAHTVTSGAGDRAAASERIDQEVKPFVDNNIRGPWLTAMRSAMAAVIRLYDAATAELTAEPDAVFDVPGDLSPSWMPPPREDDAATIPAAASTAAPVGTPWGASVGPPPPAPATAPIPTAPAAPAPASVPAPQVDAGSTAPAMAAPPSMPALGGGMPDIGSGLSGFGQQLADAFGSLLGSADEGLDTSDIDDPSVDDELDDDAEDDEEPVEPADEEEPAAQEEPVEEPLAEPACVSADTPAEPPSLDEPEPAPTPVPAPPPPPSPPPGAAAAETPCEIAADELPQVGE